MAVQEAMTSRQVRDDILRGSSGADEFDCGSGDDEMLDYDEDEGVTTRMMIAKSSSILEI